MNLLTLSRTITIQLIAGVLILGEVAAGIAGPLSAGLTASETSSKSRFS